MSNITYTNKDKNGSGVVTQWRDVDANEVKTAVNSKADASALTSHTSNTSNPHSVTKTQVGLGNVDNTSDANKPVSTATQTALDGKANTSHTHTSSNISDFTEAVQDAVAALLAAGTNISVTYNDASNTLTIEGTGGGGGGLDAEAVRDAIGVAMVGVGNISVTVNDGADTITISTTATVNDTDANLKARANHTGTQAATTITEDSTHRFATDAEKTTWNSKVDAAGALAAAPAETATTLGALTNSATAKSTPVDADMVPLMDSAASNIWKKLSWANIKATLKTYFDTLYAAVTHNHAASDINSGTIATARLGSGTANSSSFLRGDQTWAAPGGSGDMTKAVYDSDDDGVIDSDALPPLQLSGNDKIIGRVTSGAGDAEEITCTAAGRALLDDANAAAQLVTLGLTATAAELNILDGATLTTTELNYVDGVTSAIQTQFSGKVNNYTGQTFTIRSLSQATYDGLTPDANTIYLIV